MGHGTRNNLQYFGDVTFNPLDYFFILFLFYITETHELIFIEFSGEVRYQTRSETGSVFLCLGSVPVTNITEKQVSESSCFFLICGTLRTKPLSRPFHTWLDCCILLKPRGVFVNKIMGNGWMDFHKISKIYQLAGHDKMDNWEDVHAPQTRYDGGLCFGMLLVAYVSPGCISQCPISSDLSRISIVSTVWVNRIR